MLNARDMVRIESDVHGIIHDWGCDVTIRTPIPDEQQPNWNPLMHEIDGEVMYDESTISVERRDVPTQQLETNVAGNRFTGESILCIPDAHANSITTDTVFIIDGNEDEPWRVKSIKDGVGEKIIHVIRLVGEPDGD